MIVTPGRWFRNLSSQKVCWCVRVLAPRVLVRYRDSGKEQWFHSSQFVKGFEEIQPPATPARK